MKRLISGIDAGKYRAGLRVFSLTVPGRYWLSTKLRVSRGFSSRYTTGTHSTKKWGIRDRQYYYLVDLNQAVSENRKSRGGWRAEGLGAGEEYGCSLFHGPRPHLSMASADKE